jgi:[calcium/calmodulin-dependent protein kinase] kinase
MVKSAGTFHFFAPECCDTEVEKYSGRATDMWALGVTMYCMLFNVLPFWDPDINEYGILDVILKNDVKLPENTRR